MNVRTKIIILKKCAYILYTGACIIFLLQYFVPLIYYPFIIGTCLFFNDISTD